jgi:hypothetical protein
LSDVAPRRVVFAPALILASLFEEGARTQLNEWRDGKVVAVVNRELLLSYLKLLRRVGAEEDQIRQWTLWFTSPEKSIYLVDLVTNEENATEVCRLIAEAEGVVVVRPEEGSGDVRFRVVSAA